MGTVIGLPESYIAPVRRASADMSIPDPPFDAVIEPGREGDRHNRTRAPTRACAQEMQPRRTQGWVVPYFDDDMSALKGVAITSYRRAGKSTYGVFGLRTV
jgi:hypothetical protein